MKSPVMTEFPFEVIMSEAQIREDYLVNLYFPEVKNQTESGVFSKMIELLYLRKVGSYGKGRSGAAAKDFARRMKMRAQYTGRQFNGEVRPMSYFLDDPQITKLPPEKSTVLLISGSGTKQSVEGKARGCMKHKIDTIAFSYEPNCIVSKCCTVYHYIPKKIKNSFARDTLDTQGNSFETAALISGWGLVEGLVNYHKNKNLEEASNVCLSYIGDSIKYVQHLGKSLNSSKGELIKLGEQLGKTRDVRVAASGDNAASLKMAISRLAHTGRLGFDSSIDFISSDDFGPPGFSDMQKDDLVIISSAELDSSHTIAIGREATAIGAKMCLIASDRLTDSLLKSKLSKYEIRNPDILLRLPYSLPNSNVRLFDLGVRHILEYEAAAVFEYLGMTKKELEDTHLQEELE